MYLEDQVSSSFPSSVVGSNSRTIFPSSSRLSNHRLHTNQYSSMSSSVSFDLLSFLRWSESESSWRCTELRLRDNFRSSSSLMSRFCFFTLSRRAEIDRRSVSESCCEPLRRDDLLSSSSLLSYLSFFAPGRRPENWSSLVVRIIPRDSDPLLRVEFLSSSSESECRPLLELTFLSSCFCTDFLRPLAERLSTSSSELSRWPLGFVEWRSWSLSFESREEGRPEGDLLPVNELRRPPTPFCYPSRCHCHHCVLIVLYDLWGLALALRGHHYTCADGCVATSHHHCRLVAIVTLVSWRPWPMVITTTSSHTWGSALQSSLGVFVGCLWIKIWQSNSKQLTEAQY